MSADQAIPRDTVVRSVSGDKWTGSALGYERWDQRSALLAGK